MMIDSPRPSRSRRRLVPASTVWLLMVLGCVAGCDQLSKQFSLSSPPLPDLGAPIDSSISIDLDPSVTNAKAQYTNSCGRIEELNIGTPLEDNILMAAHQTFKTVVPPGGGPAAAPETAIRVRLLEPKLTIRTDAVYDRAPTELVLDSLVEFRDASGNLLSEQPLQLVYQERLKVDLEPKRCGYIIHYMMRDAAQVYAVRFSKLLRTQYEALHPATAGVSGVTVKAAALDANGNGVWEAGERVRVRVDVTNGGATAVPGLTVKLGVPASLVTPFGTSTMSVGQLTPGETRTVEFAGTVPAGLEGQRADLTVAVSDSTGATSAPQPVTAKLGGAPALVRPGRTDDIDTVPTANGLQRPQVFLVSVGITAHRDPGMVVRKFAAADAELVTAYFEALGGVPPANVRILQDRKALRPDIEEAILDWLPSRLSPESLVILYFSGQAKVTATGEVFLVPFEGGPSSTARLYPLKDLEAALARLKARHVVLIFDGPVTRLGEAKGRKDPQWDGGGTHLIRLIGPGSGASESDKLRHGTFTHSLLRGLRGEADENLNGEVTLGELASFLAQDSRPLIIPLLQSGSRSAGVLLTKPASPLAATSGR